MKKKFEAFAGVMVVALGATLTASIGTAATAPEPTIEVRNLMADFWVFWPEAQDKPPAAQLRWSCLKLPAVPPSTTLPLDRARPTASGSRAASARDRGS
jgi:hypothetical protein